VAALSRDFGLELDPDARVGDLSVGLQQRVEILKLLYRDASFLILDEPTAVLTPSEIRSFFGILRNLARRGKTVLLITHKLAEVVEIAESVTVMRRGRSIARLETARTSPGEMARLMVGRDLAGPAARAARGAGAPVLRIEDLVVLRPGGAPALDGVAVEVRAGEILGVAGVEGNGQRELVEVIAGLARPARGRARLGDADLTRMGPREIARSGVAHVPEDRRRRGLVLEFSVEDNLILGLHDRPPVSGRLRLDRGVIRARAVDLLASYDVRPPDPEAAARSLSGGNQQKVILARELSRHPRLLVVAQPTRGLDVGAMEFVHQRILEERDRGAAVLLVSADLAEVRALSDRIIVLYRGRIAGERGRDADEEELGALMTGASGA
jgi:simple sugar transport system ATP-binding protein